MYVNDEDAGLEFGEKIRHVSTGFIVFSSYTEHTILQSLYRNIQLYDFVLKRDSLEYGKILSAVISTIFHY